MLSDSYAMSLFQEASDFRRQSLVSETCRRLNMHTHKHTRHWSGQMDVNIANRCSSNKWDLWETCACCFPCLLTVWRIWTGSLIRCCPSKFWTNLKPSPTSYKRYVLPENVFCGYHQCHESLVEKSNSVCIKITPYKQPHELSCPLQEEMQKAAFQALQLQKDSVHGYIRKQVCVGGWRWVGSGLNLSLVSAFFYGIDRMELTVNDKLYSWGCGLMFSFSLRLVQQLQQALWVCKTYWFVQNHI